MKDILVSMVLLTGMSLRLSLAQPSSNQPPRQFPLPPGDGWRPIVFKIAETSSSTLDVDLPAEGGSFTFNPKVGDAFGGHAVILELGERGRAFFDADYEFALNQVEFGFEK